MSSGVSGAPIIRGIGAPSPDGGRGGLATATGGTGGAGLKPHKHGASGGTATAVGGRGGARGLRSATGAPIGLGGTGGSVLWKGATGGAGWNDCVTGQLEAGGNGGAGGAAAGGPGEGGLGPPNGVRGAATFESVSNGGRAGDGAAPGARGAAGANQTANTAEAEHVGTTFSDGGPGVDCTPPPPPPPPPAVELGISFPVSSGVVPLGEYSWPLRAGGSTVGSVSVLTEGSAGSHFVGQSPTRVGWSASGGWRFDLASAQVGGVAYLPDEFELCVLNTSFGGAPLQEDGAAPVVMNDDVRVVMRNALLTIIASHFFLSNSCQRVPIPLLAVYISLFGTGTGLFADAYLFKLFRDASH